MKRKLIKRIRKILVPDFLPPFIITSLIATFFIIIYLSAVSFIMNLGTGMNLRILLDQFGRDFPNFISQIGFILIAVYVSLRLFFRLRPKSFLRFRISDLFFILLFFPILYLLTVKLSQTLGREDHSVIRFVYLYIFIVLLFMRIYFLIIRFKASACDAVRESVWNCDYNTLVVRRYVYVRSELSELMVDASMPKGVS